MSRDEKRKILDTGSLFVGRQAPEEGNFWIPAYAGMTQKIKFKGIISFRLNGIQDDALTRASFFAFSFFCPAEFWDEIFDERIFFRVLFNFFFGSFALGDIQPAVIWAFAILVSDDFDHIAIF